MNQVSYSLIEKRYKLKKQINSKVFIVQSQLKNQLYVKKIYDYSDELYNILSIIQNENLNNCIKICVIERHWDIGKIYVLEEYNINGNLYDYINKTQNFNIDWIIQCLYDIIKGLQQLSKYQYMHRDIKPQNIVFDGKQFNLIDFETSKCYRQDFSILQSQIGTQTCIAPEVQLNIAYSSKCDIWSVGCVLYYILYKKFPLQNYDRRALLNFYYSKKYGLTKKRISHLILQIYPNKLQSNEQIKLPSQTNIELEDLLQQMLKAREIDRVSLNALYFQLKMIKILIKFKINDLEENLASLIIRIKFILQSEQNKEICQKIYTCFKAVLSQNVNQETQEDQKRQHMKIAVKEITQEFKNEGIYLDLIKQINQYIQE